MSTTGSLFELVNRLAVRAVGRRPRWAVQDATTGPPTSASSGVNISNAVKTSVQIALREDVHRKTTKIEATADPGGGATEYQITIDGNVWSEPANATGNDLLVFLAGELNADAAISAIVTAAVDDGQLVLRGDGEDSYTVAVSILNGDGTIEITHEDADSADLEAYVRQAGTADRPSNWTRRSDLDFTALDEGGESKTFDTAGLSRIYYRVTDVTPSGASVKASIGPAGLE